MARKKSAMSDEHKAALAAGREQGRIVRNYLEALESHRPKRGRKRTTDSITRRLEAIDHELAEADPLKRLQLTQERMDLQDELAASGGEGVDLEQLEADFIEVGWEYGERKGITYSAWREVGVPAATLKAAGITRAAGY